MVMVLSARNYILQKLKDILPGNAGSRKPRAVQQPLLDSKMRKSFLFYRPVMPGEIPASLQTGSRDRPASWSRLGNPG